MPETLEHIPLFPLNIFLLPGEQLPLHVFEPRYRQMFQEAEDDDLRFGLPCEEESLGVHMVSVCRLVRVSKRYQSGESDVIIEAVRVGTLEKFESVFPNKLYPGGFVRPFNNSALLETPELELVEAFRKYIELRYGTKPSHSNIAHYRILDLAASIAMSNLDKMKMILMDSPEQQSAKLLNTLRYLNLLLLQEQKIENGFILN